MAIRHILHGLRALLIGLCALSLFAFAVQWSIRNPDGTAQGLLLTIADAPRFVVATITNVVSDRFALSRTPDEFSRLHRYTPIPNHSGHRIDGLVMRVGKGMAPQPGWRVLYGIFRIDGAPAYAAIALSPALVIEHVWPVDGKGAADRVTPFEPAPYPHGFALLDDGSIVAGFDTNYRTMRIGPCGEVRWISDAYLNHAIYAMDDDRFAWGVGNYDTIQRIDLRTGRIVRSIDMEALRAANPDITALDMLRIDGNGLGDNSRDFDEGSHDDPYHLNDAEPLTPAMARHFPQFRAGDLLLSFRSLNMIAVVDPATLRIKWFSNDYTFRQHDPDWEANGEISVLDNQMGRDFSRIVALDPRTGGHRTIVPGRPLQFYTRIRGKHQSLPDGGMSITSSGQGRVLELDRSGRIALEILDRDVDQPGASPRNFLISEAVTYPANAPPFGRIRPCPR